MSRIIRYQVKNKDVSPFRLHLASFNSIRYWLLDHLCVTCRSDARKAITRKELVGWRGGESDSCLDSFRKGFFFFWFSGRGEGVMRTPCLTDLVVLCNWPDFLLIRLEIWHLRIISIFWFFLKVFLLLFLSSWWRLWHVTKESWLPWKFLYQKVQKSISFSICFLSFALVSFQRHFFSNLSVALTQSPMSFFEEVSFLCRGCIFGI